MAETATTVHTSFDWRLFLVLCALTLVAAILIIPYSAALTTESLPVEEDSPATFLILVVTQILTTVVLTWPLTAVGLLLAPRIGLGAPILSRWLRGKVRGKRDGRTLGIAFALGLGAGVLVIALSSLASPFIEAEFERLGRELPSVNIPAWWQGLLASISAGITEEVLLRLFGLTFLAWLGSLISRKENGRPRRIVLWGANIISAVAFGLLHLPLASSLDLVTPLLLLQTVGLNTLVGLIFGWVYWQMGLGSAMVAHFSTDVVLHVIPPLFALFT